MSKLHDLVVKNKRKDFSKTFPWNSACDWQPIIVKLEELDFYYEMKDEKSAIIGLLDFDSNQNYLLFEIDLQVPQIVRPVYIVDGNISVTTQDEYRCPPQYDKCFDDLAYAISQDILPKERHNLLKVLQGIK